MNNDALTLIPARVRQVVYVVLSLVSLGLTGLGLFLHASPWGEPWWVGSALQALGVVAAPFGVLAAANVQPDSYPDQIIVQDGSDEPKVLS